MQIGLVKLNNLFVYINLQALYSIQYGPWPTGTITKYLYNTRQVKAALINIFTLTIDLISTWMWKVSQAATNTKRIITWLSFLYYFCLFLLFFMALQKKCVSAVNVYMPTTLITPDLLVLSLLKEETVCLSAGLKHITFKQCSKINFYI